MLINGTHGINNITPVCSVNQEFSDSVSISFEFKAMFVPLVSLVQFIYVANDINSTSDNVNKASVINNIYQRNKHTVFSICSVLKWLYNRSLRIHMVHLPITQWISEFANIYRPTSNIRRTKSKNNSRLVLQLSLCNRLKPGACRRCPYCIWVTNSFITYSGFAYLESSWYLIHRMLQDIVEISIALTLENTL